MECRALILFACLAAPAVAQDGIDNLPDVAKRVFEAFKTNDIKKMEVLYGTAADATAM